MSSTDSGVDPVKRGFSLLFLERFRNGSCCSSGENGTIAEKRERSPKSVIYVLNKGIEVFARTAQIYVIIILMMGLISSFFVIAAGLVDLNNLFPLHPKDWIDALKSAYPNIWIFPFGEAVCFTTIFPHLNKAHAAKTTGIVETPGRETVGIISTNNGE
ncbi:GerAB/ArcD/ProY family transporter [Paenibacillus sp. BR2-3]|uniref:GerAB/ArcD/ProY family transporter n=1 Tax=Paenibacillus sp. BR2-3 TaxID=3048494 RepID=UPI003977AD48